MDERSGRIFMAIVILVCGVVGGLILVISIMFFYKYCVKSKQDSKEQPRGIKSLVSRIQPNIRILKLFKYDSVEASLGSKIGQDGPSVPDTAAKSGEGETIEFSSENEIDAAVAEYIYKLKDTQDEELMELGGRHPTQTGPKRHESVTSESELSRHVSFEVDIDQPSSMDRPEPVPNTERRRSSHAPPLHSKSASLPVTTHKSVRYTEGDFHHLKNSRIDRSPRSMPRTIKQSSLPMPSLSHQAFEHSAAPDDDISEITPMLGPACADKSPIKRTKVRAEVHKTATEMNGGPHVRPCGREVKVDRDHNGMEFTHRDRGERMHRLLPSLDKVKRSRDKLAVLRDQGQDRQARSLDVLSKRADKWHDANRRVKSYEEDFVQLRSYRRESETVDYDRFKITEFSRLPASNPHFGTVSEALPGNAKSKVRYNDIGSFEEINDKVIDGIVEDIAIMSESETETLNGTRKYKELWNLRTTFEEDEDLSDTIRMADGTSPELSPEEKEPTTSVTTSFESNTEPTVSQSNMSSQANNVSVPTDKAPVKLLHPNYEKRRKSYQSIFNRRMQRGDYQGTQRPAENSFDSFETMDTDGDVSESSRQEVTTTSFESTGTTDNTDSTGDSSSHKLQQMRGDSGYKSLETQNSQNAEISPKSPKGNSLTPTPAFPAITEYKAPAQDVPKAPKSQRIQAVAFQEQGRSSSLPETHKPSRSDPHRSSHYFDRRAAKSASKKRRDFRSPRHQNVRIHECVPEAESDSRSDQPSGDSFEETTQQGNAKFSIFNKIIRSKSEQTGRARAQMQRDYSIDHKTDAVFNEFLRHDEAFDTPGKSTRGSPGHKQRIQRKNSEVFPAKKERYTRGNRSASVDSSSTALVSFHKISPQDSIEEEDEEEWQTSTVSNAQMIESQNSPHKHSKGESSSRHGAKTMSNIPVIRLPQETGEA